MPEAWGGRGDASRSGGEAYRRARWPSYRGGRARRAFEVACATARARALLAGNCRGFAGEIRFFPRRTLPSFCRPRRKSLCSSSVHGTPEGGGRDGGERQSVARASTSRAGSETEMVRGKRTTTTCRQKSRTLLALARGRDGRVGEVSILRRRGGGVSHFGQNFVRGLRLAHALGRGAHERVETGYAHFAANFGASARKSRSDFDRRASARDCDLRRSARGRKGKN